MNKAHLAFGLLGLGVACEGRTALLDTAPQCTCVTAPQPADMGADAASEPAESSISEAPDSAAEAGNEPDAYRTNPDGMASESGSDAFATIDAPAETEPPVYPAWCSDQVKDGDETDVDCGGHCPPCGPRMDCLIDADCSKTAPGCDVGSGGCYCDAVAFICVHSHCFDHVKDGDESDGDCGGAICPLCAVGQTCGTDGDCSSAACDAISLRCIENQCADHQQDGTESDVDCGGNVCPACALGQHCSTSFDCPAGHVCSPLHACE